MKKLLSVSVASLAFASVAAYPPVSVGVTEITPTSVNTIVPAPYQSLADGEAIAVQDLVKAANLPDGTMLYYYNGSKFNAWIKGTESDAGKWIGSSITTKDGISVSPGSSTVKLAVGSALWVVLPKAPTTEKIYIYGKPSEITSTTVAAGSTALIGNPRAVNATPVVSNAANGDTITIVSGDSPVVYTFNAKLSKWGAWTQSSNSSFPVFAEWNNPAIASGSGFWYNSKGASQVTINWNVQ